VLNVENTLAVSDMKIQGGYGLSSPSAEARVVSSIVLHVSYPAVQHYSFHGLLIV